MKATIKMSAKEYLRQLRRLDVEIEAKLREYERIRSIATWTGANLTHERVSGGKRRISKVEDCAIKLVTLEDELRRDIARLTAQKTETLLRINELTMPDHRTLLLLYYVNGMTWEEIAVHMSFSYRHTLRLHGYALTEFDKLHRNTCD